MNRIWLLLLATWLSTGQLLPPALPRANSATIFVDSDQELTSVYGNTSQDVALGDVDGDGDVDALVAQGSSGATQENVLWLNDGAGQFQEADQTVGGGDSRGVALGDVDGDGDLDALFANAGSSIDNDDQLWINQGGAQDGPAGTFVKAQDLANGPSRMVVLGDLDGDSDLDALIGGDSYQIWWNDGTGRFNVGPMLGISFANAVALADLDADLDPDVVFAGEGSFAPTQVFWNDWGYDKSFRAGATLSTPGVNSGVAVADLNDDKRPDIFIASSQADQVWWGLGDRAFSDGALLGNENDSDVALGDVDGDGDVDAFVIRRTGDKANGVWLNMDDQTFVLSDDRLGNYTSVAVALADLDGDTDLDAFVANSGPNKVWQNSTQTTPPPEQIRPFSQSDQILESSSEAVALGDVDGNGGLDAVVTGIQGTQLWRNGVDDTPLGLFTPGQELGSEFGMDVALGDLDGNHSLDVLVAYGAGDGFQVWLNGVHGDPPGTFSLGQAGGEDGIGVALGDLDGDQDLDAVLVSPFGSTAWLNGEGGDAPGVFRDSGQLLPAASHVALGDVDGDQDLDAVLSGWADVIVLLNGENGGSPGTLVAAQSLDDGDSVEAALGDLDGDSDLDLFVANFGLPSQIWLNGQGDDPPGLFSDSGQAIELNAASGVRLGDLNGDGDLDAFISVSTISVQGSVNQIWLNSGDGTGTLTGQCLGNELSSNAALGDVDNDDDLDAVVSDFFEVTLWLNGVGEVCTCVVDWLLAQQNPGRVRSEDPTQIFRDVRDQLLASDVHGHRYAHLYYTYNAEVFGLLAADADLRAQALSLLQVWAPSLQALLDGQGDDVTVSAAQMQDIGDFLEVLSAAASPQLAGAIAQELDRLPPLSNMAGMSVADAAEVVLNGQETFLPLLKR